ncbi:MAG: hypothetical protein KAS93_07360 [Gammaproteobacteria bacterium]|nr:hypothetical protein [Gammaproteobacteria bacterium]
MNKHLEGRSVEILTWSDIRSKVVGANKELASIIDAIDPSAHYKFIKANYVFGDLIIRNGELQLPANDSLVGVMHEDVSQEVKNQISYSNIPLMLSLDKDNEVFVDTGSRIVPLNLFHKGSLLGLFEIIDFMFKHKATSSWSISAGSRSIMMLPKITDKISLNRLRMFYDIPSTIRVKYLSDHWELFRAIARHSNFKQEWNNSMLFFGKAWMTSKNNSPGWNRLRNYLFEQAWHQARFSMGKIDLSLNWEKFVEAISLRNLKPRPYLADQIKHILSIATGKFPAFRPIDDRQLAAPTEGLMKSFVDVYMLKNYIPTMMHVCPLNEITKNPVYYSLSFPTLLEGSPLNKISTTIMVDIRDVKQLIDTLKKYSAERIGFEHNVVDNTQFDYFHVEEDALHEIKASNNIFVEDEGFLAAKKLYPDRSFCLNSQFFRGCIKITATS